MPNKAKNETVKGGRIKKKEATANNNTAVEMKEEASRKHDDVGLRRKDDVGTEMAPAGRDGTSSGKSSIPARDNTSQDKANEANPTGTTEDGARTTDRPISDTEPNGAMKSKKGPKVETTISSVETTKSSNTEETEKRIENSTHQTSTKKGDNTKTTKPTPKHKKTGKGTENNTSLQKTTPKVSVNKKDVTNKAVAAEEPSPQKKTQDKNTATNAKNTVIDSEDPPKETDEPTPRENVAYIARLKETQKKMALMKATVTALEAEVGGTRETIQEAEEKKTTKKEVVPILDEEGMEELHGLPDVISELNDILSTLTLDVAEIRTIFMATSGAVDKMEEKHETNWPQLVWRIDLFKKKFKEAKYGIKPIIFSPSFETHPHGYRLALSLCPYGDGKARGQHMSLFFCILKGDYDTLQAWPFSPKITFTLVSQAAEDEDRTDLERTFTPNSILDNMPFLGKPVKARNPSLGIPQFAAIDELWTREFVKDDTLFIRIQVDVSNIIPV